MPPAGSHSGRKQPRPCQRSVISASARRDRAVVVGNVPNDRLDDDVRVMTAKSATAHWGIDSRAHRSARSSARSRGRPTATARSWSCRSMLSSRPSRCRLADQRVRHAKVSPRGCDRPETWPELPRSPDMTNDAYLIRAPQGAIAWTMAEAGCTRASRPPTALENDEIVADRQRRRLHARRDPARPGTASKRGPDHLLG